MLYGPNVGVDDDFVDFPFWCLPFYLHLTHSFCYCSVGTTLGVCVLLNLSSYEKDIFSCCVITCQVKAAASTTELLLLLFEIAGQWPPSIAAAAAAVYMPSTVPYRVQQIK